MVGITLSKEQKSLAEQRVRAEGLEHLVTFELVDYREFGERPENAGAFDRVVSCEMIEAVGHAYLGDFFACVQSVLAWDGVLVMEAITTPECVSTNRSRAEPRTFSLFARTLRTSARFRSPSFVLALACPPGTATSRTGARPT